MNLYVPCSHTRALHRLPNLMQVTALENDLMNLNVVCPVCNHEIELSQDSEGRKLRCGHCDSKSRVKVDENGKFFLRVLEETLNWEARVQEEVVEEEPVVMAEETLEPAKKPAGPKLRTRRDKFREEEAGATAGGGRRPTTRGRSTRRRRF